VHAYQVFTIFGDFTIILNFLTCVAVALQVFTIFYYFCCKLCCAQDERRLSYAVEYHSAMRGVLIPFFVLEMIVVYALRCFGPDDDEFTGCADRELQFTAAIIITLYEIVVFCM